MQMSGVYFEEMLEYAYSSTLQCKNMWKEKKQAQDYNTRAQGRACMTANPGCTAALYVALQPLYSALPHSIGCCMYGKILPNK